MSLTYEQGALNPDQVFLSMHLNGLAWTYIPLIKINKRKVGQLFDTIPTNTYGCLAFNDFFNEKKQYILENQVREASRKKPGERSEYDKEIIQIDERFNLLFNVLSGNYLRIFPKRDDPSQTWYSPNSDLVEFNEEDARFINGIMSLYFEGIEYGQQTGEWTKCR